MAGYFILTIFVVGFIYPVVSRQGKLAEKSV